MRNILYGIVKKLCVASYANYFNPAPRDRFQVVIHFWINWKYLSSEI
jgi:hypothetical protein